MFYNSFEAAKDGSLIPYFFNNKPMFSVYNPKRDVERFLEKISSITEKTCLFVAGIGTGIHLSFLLENPNLTLIFALEVDKKTIDQVQEFIPKSNKIISCTMEDFQDKLINNYIPQIHGNFIFEIVKSWGIALNQYNNEFSEDYIREKILLKIKDISRDIGTQSYFGKLWHKNILHNIHNYSLAKENNLLIDNSYFDTNKIAAIIGASPNLDNQIQKIIENRNKYFIFATDTSFQVLLQNQIFPDSVVTLDGQIASAKHFFESLDKKTLFIADFCSNSSIVKKIVSQKCKIAFTNSGHPLVSIFNIWLELNKIGSEIFIANSGNGTVLQLALDFAFSVGFEKYELFGADFAYTNNKSYSKGTYFDFEYNSSSEKINSTENLFTKLMYRGKTIKTNDDITTETLTAYKNYLMEYLNNKKLHSKNQIITNQNQFDSRIFFNWYIENLENKEKNVKKTILPLLAWINNCNKNSDKYNEIIHLTKKLIRSFIEEKDGFKKN